MTVFGSIAVPSMALNQADMISFWSYMFTSRVYKNTSFRRNKATANNDPEPARTVHRRGIAIGCDDKWTSHIVPYFYFNK